jgi:hypothetical protein
MKPLLFSVLRTQRSLLALSELREGRPCDESFFTLGFAPLFSSLVSARPSHPATAANPRAAIGSTPDPQATSRPSGTSDNNSSRSMHTGSFESSSRTVCTAGHTAHERTSPPETQSPSPEISLALPRAAHSSKTPESPESPDTTDQSLPLSCAASTKPAKAARETEFHPNKHCQSR